jgi:ribulose-phosphate 3-epimerase
MLYCPSMMCSDFNSLQKEVAALDKAGADIFHIDIMDGKFVPNFGMGLQDIEVIRKNTNKLVDVHLMIANPSEYISLFADLGVDIIYVHPESDMQVARTLDQIKACGKQAGIALNPGTSIAQVAELFPLVDYVMVMTVNPGFAGQQYLSFVDAKIQKLVALKAEYDFQVLIDGAVSVDVIHRLSKIGVDGFVLGTSALFKKEQSYPVLFKSFPQ